MKILIEACGVPPTMLMGWCRALAASDFEVAGMRDYEHVFDVFREFKPDIFIATRPPNRAVSKCVANRRMKVVNMDLRPAFDSVTYKPGVFNPALACDLAFVAEWTADKVGLYRSFLDPVIKSGLYSVKCFGAGEGCPYPQHLGWLDHSLLGDLYASAKFCLDLSRWGVTERRHQIAGLGGCCLSNVFVFDEDREVDGPDELLDRLGDSTRHTSDLQTHVMQYETYFNRLADGFLAAGLVNQAADLINKGVEYVRGS